MEPLTDVLEWDAAARAWLTSHHHPVADVLMVGLSVVGRAGMIWLAIGLVLVLLDRRRLPAFGRLVIALLLAYGMTDGVVKPLVARARPFESSTVTRVLDERPGTYSFPSGHAAASIAGAATLTYLWPGGRWLLWSMALLVSFSRIYVGVHYPLDIAGGALVGLASAWGAARLVAQRSSLKIADR